MALSGALACNPEWNVAHSVLIVCVNLSKLEITTLDFVAYLKGVAAFNEARLPFCVICATYLPVIFVPVPPT